MTTPSTPSAPAHTLPQPGRAPTPAPAPRPAVQAAQPTMRLIHPLGTELTLPTSGATFYADRRRYGAQGYTDPQDATMNPLELPRCMQLYFDWTLIGGKMVQFKDKDTQEDTHGVIYKGRLYKYRQLPGNKKLGLPEGDAKFSRGAKEGEETIAGGASGENKGYVTLAHFRSKGPPIPEYCRPGTEALAREAYEQDPLNKGARAQAGERHQN